MSTQSTAKGGWLDRTFRLSEKHTTVKREFLAGLTTFLTMVYIVAVNPSILGDAGMDKNAQFYATAISSAIAPLCTKVEKIVTAESFDGQK